MENDAKLFRTESPVHVPNDLYGCISLAKVNRNRNVVEQGEATKRNVNTFKSLLEEGRDLILFAEHAVIVAERKMDWDHLDTYFENKMGWLHLVYTKRK